MNPTVSVFSDVVCHLGEGPAAHPALGRLFWFDILEKRLLERPFDRTGTVVHQLPVHASAMAVVDEGRQLLLADDGIHLRDVASGALSHIVPLEADDRRKRSNDARVHPSGSWWISTMSWTFDPGMGTIWWFRGGEIRPIVPNLGIPNAISFAPDGSHAYFADSKAGTLYRVDTDPATGLPTAEPTVFRTFGEGEGGPDGAVVDVEGVLWNARWGAGMVDAYAPDGVRLRSIPVPARQCSCPAFVGAGADRLVVTSAQEGMDAAARAADPLSGQTFLIDFPVRGRFDTPVLLG